MNLVIDPEVTRRRRVVRFAACIAAAAAGLMMSLPGSTRAAGGPGPGPESGIAWGRCSEKLLRQAGAQCGYLSVPLDYSDLAGPRIRLAVSRIRHTARAYQGVVLVNPGGPGLPGLDSGASVRTSLLDNGFRRAARDYDWIGFDPRGVGASRPALSCTPDYFSPRRPEYAPSTNALLERWLARSTAYAHACEARSKAQAMLLRNMTTRDSALDVDSIRRALGQRQITYYGFSDGTYLGEVYATLFPSRVRRLIFDSIVDPRTVWYQTNLDQDVPVNRNENLWFRWLARHHHVFGLGRTERSVTRLFYVTEQRLEHHPAAGKVGPDEWEDAFLEAAYVNVIWPYFGEVFSDWVHKHNRAAARELTGLYRIADTPGHDNAYAAYLAVECTDAPWPLQWSTWSRDNWALYRRARFGTWSNVWFNAPCIYWPAPASQPVEVNGSKIRSALLIDDTLDAATPFEGSLQVRHLFPHAVLLAEPGGTNHGYSLYDSSCVERTIAGYLTTGALPRRKAHAKWDRTCAPVPPFSPSLASATVATGTAHADRELSSMSLGRASRRHAGREFP